MHFLTFIARNLLRRRARTALTVLGIAVSVGAMVALLSVSSRFTAAMEESFDKRGVDLVVLSGGVIDQLSSDIDERIGHEIRKIPGVKAVTPGLVELVEVQRGNSNISVLVQGWPEENFARNELTIVRGRPLDFSQHGKVLIGSKLAENLKKDLGDTVFLTKQPFEVVGIFDSFVIYETGGAVLPLEELQELVSRPGRVTGISVICDDASDKAGLVRAVKDRIESMPATTVGRKGLSAMPVRDYLENAIHLRIATGMAWMISAIAIVIGTIGMVNTMVMSVLERVQEIGILRAVGWPRSRIVRMVLGEALLLGFMGAVIGIIGAFVMVQVLTHVPAVSGFIDGKMAPRAIFAGLGMTLIMGLVGGAYPALRAARLAPTEALRHE